MTSKRGPAAQRRAGLPARALALACATATIAIAGPAAALSLGRAQGTPWIGRPLQLTVPVTDAGEDPCVRAEMSQGDEPPVPLQWRLERRGDGSTWIRLASPSAVLEPVVTVRLAVGCADRLHQTFVLLADLPAPARESLPEVARPTAPEPASSVAAAPPPAAAAPAAAGEAPAARPAPSSARRSRVAAATDAPARSAERPRRTREPAPAAAAERSATGKAPAAGARLQVELLDVAIDQAPALKTSSRMADPAQGGALSRTQAQAEWQRLQAPPDEQLAALQRQSEATLAELRSLREVTKRQAEQLDRIGAERDLMRDALAVLAGALAVGFGLLAWRRTRDRTGGPWWQGSRAAAALPQPKQDSEYVDSSYPDEAVAAAPPPEDDSGWSDFSRPGAPAPAPAASLPAPRASAFTDSVMGRSRLPSAEELLDVQEKANFFLAIGQPDQAIQMLESRLMEHLGSSPFLWLDLLDLCRRLGRRDDYERVRQGFQKAFAARLPSFDEAQPNSEGLERYPRALSRITLLWPTSRVLKEIEKSLFEDPAPGSIMFDLEASRDLLLLYSIAHEVVTEQPDGQPYDRTQMGTLEPQAPAREAGGPTTEPVPLMALDAAEGTPDEADLDLDLDFSQLDQLPPERKPTLPAVAAKQDVAPAPEAEAAAPMPVDFSEPGSAGALDLVLDDAASTPAAAGEGPGSSAEAAGAPDTEGADAEALIADLQLEDRAVAAPVGQVDTTPPEPPMLADLQLDGLELEAIQPRPADEPDTPLPEVLDLAEDGPPPKAPKA